MVSSDVAERWNELSKSFDHIGWYRGWSFNATADGNPERFQAGLVSAEFFACLQASPAQGRTFDASEMKPGNDLVVVLGNSFWQSHFGSDPGVIGQSIRLDGVPHMVISVMAEDFRTFLPFIDPDVELWAPISREYQDDRRWSVVTAIGRLKSGIAQQQAQSEMEAISKQLEQEGRRFKDRGVNLVRLDEEVASGSRQGLLIMFGAVGCVLLIACANLAGLLLSHTLEREKEIGIRMALGATRGRILRQLLTECLLLSVIGGAAGMVLSNWLARAIVSLQPADIPRLDTVSNDMRVLLFGLGLSAVTGVVFGLLPALKFSRETVIGVLKKSSQQSRRSRLPLTPRNLLLAAEIALTVMLLIGTGLLLRSLALLKSVDTGLKAEGLLTMIVPLSDTSYSSPRQQAEFARELLERARATATVESAAVSNSLPLQNRYLFGMRLQIEGKQLPDDTGVAVRAISGDYFSTMRIPLLRGRDLSLADEGRAEVAIVNREMAERFWPGSDPIGMRITLEKGKPRTIIGVVGNVKSSSLDANPETEVYVPFAEEPTLYIGFAVRSSGDLQSLAATVRALVREIDPDQPVTQVATMREMVEEFFGRPRFNFMLFGSFAALALTLSVVGIYALISHSVTRRTHEIGIRMALGARRLNVLLLFMRDGAFIAVSGIVSGLLAASVTARLLASMLFGIAPEDGLTFAAVSIVMLVVCLAATYFPARRTMKVDPMVALRHE